MNKQYEVQERDRGIIEAAGGLVWRNSERGRELAVIHRPRLDDWALPKGKLDPGEGWRQAALREVEEETCCTAAIGDLAGCICYMVDGLPKVVLFWNMELKEEQPFIGCDEVDQLEWMTPDEAVAKLHYEGERELVRKSALKNG